MPAQMTRHAPHQDRPVSHVLVIVAAIVFLIWSVSQAQSVLASFLVSVFLSLLAAPLVVWLQQKHVPVILAVSMVIIAMISVLGAIGAVVGTSVYNFYDAMPEYQARIQAHVTDLKVFLASKNIAAPDKLLTKYVNPGEVMTLTARLLARLGAAFSNIIIIMLTVTFILLEASSFPDKLRAVLGHPHQTFPQFTKFIKDMKRYMFVKTLVSLSTGILITVWLYILGVDFPILWGFLAFMLNYVPSVGSTIAGIPASLLALVQLGIGKAALVAGGFVVVNFVLDYGVEQTLMGRKLGLSTLVVFLSLIFWGSLLGPVGAVLCIPLTITMKFGFELSDKTRWVALLLGPADLDRSAPHAPQYRLSTRKGRSHESR